MSITWFRRVHRTPTTAAGAFDIPELCDKFGLPLEWFYEHNDDICRELDERDEVADYEQNYDWNNHPLDYDLVYYTDFCHFEEA